MGYTRAMDPIPLKDDAVQSMLRHAAEIGQQNGIDLDFTEKSVKAIDKMLDNFHKEILQDPEPNQEALSGLSLSLGIYLGETLRRNSTVDDITWRYGTPQTGGDPTAYLFRDGNEVYTVDWVAKQLMGGGSESVWKKYQLFSKKLAA